MINGPWILAFGEDDDEEGEDEGFPRARHSTILAILAAGEIQRDFKAAKLFEM